MINEIRPLFKVTLADEVDTIKAKCIALEKEHNALKEMNARLQEAIVEKDACIIEKTKELAEIKTKFERLRCIVHKNFAKVDAIPSGWHGNWQPNPLTEH